MNFPVVKNDTSLPIPATSIGKRVISQLPNFEKPLRTAPRCSRVFSPAWSMRSFHWNSLTAARALEVRSLTASKPPAILSRASPAAPTRLFQPDFSPAFAASKVLFIRPFERFTPCWRLVCPSEIRCASSGEKKPRPAPSSAPIGPVPVIAPAAAPTAARRRRPPPAMPWASPSDFAPPLVPAR